MVCLDKSLLRFMSGGVKMKVALISIVVGILVSECQGYVANQHRRKHPGFTIERSSPDNLTLPQKLYITGQNAVGLADHELVDHPLDPLTTSEIRLTKFIISTVRGYTKWLYKWITLKEPEKARLVRSFLRNDDVSVMTTGTIYRRVLVLLEDPSTNEHFEAVVNLNKITLDSWKQVEAVGATVSMADIISAEDIVFGNMAVHRRVQQAGYNMSQIVCDTWDAGYVADNPNYVQSRKLLQMYFYAVESEEDNFYAHPLDFVVYVDLHSNMVRGIETVPSSAGFSQDVPKRGNFVPKEKANYLPELLANNSVSSGRLHPIKVTQPDGPSFQLHGHRVSWHNFVFRVGYTGREGVVLHHVRHTRNNEVRPVIYRMSLSEILVTYGDPRPPFHRKKSLEMGEFKLGFSAAQLPPHSLCRGEATYLDMIIHNDGGDPLVLRDAICLVEEDAGTLWAHYDRANDKTAVQRNQRLSVKFLATLGHSDYIISWRFYQDATIELNVQLTGLKNTNLMGVEVKSPLYGNLMSPQLFSPIAQYFFSVRIDADVDSDRNSLVVQDIMPVDGETGSSANPYGNGIYRRETLMRTVEQARTNVNPKTGRTWKITNPSGIHSVTRSPVAWKLVPKGDQVPLLLKRNSPLRVNTTVSWTDYNVWALPYRDDQLFASGLWMKGDGLWDWATGNLSASLSNTDLVLWHTFSITSLPTVEDWPVSSDYQGSTGFVLKPDAFFERNPAM